MIIIDQESIAEYESLSECHKKLIDSFIDDLSKIQEISPLGFVVLYSAGYVTIEDVWMVKDDSLTDYDYMMNGQYYKLQNAIV